MKKNFTIFIASLCINTIAFAQAKYLTSFKTDYEGGLSVTVKSGDKIFFSAPDSLHGRELWVTDGTPAGTYMVKDIYPGTSNGVSINFNFSAYDFNGILYFKANNGVNGPELWRSNGTGAGTWMVKDLYADNTEHGIGDFASTDSLLYFTTSGTTVWRSNGTAEGTYQLRTFMIARNLATYKNNLYFSAATDNNGEELWKSNGASGSTFLLKDINGVAGTSLPCNFHKTDNALYFTAVTNSGWELWKTNGAASGTQMVKDINPGGANSVIDFYSETVITNIGNTIYFKASDGVTGYQLWKSDGTETGTTRLSNIADQVSQYCRFPIVNGKVFFNDYNGPNYWQYDPASGLVSATGYPFNVYFDYNYNRNASFIGSHLYYAGVDSVYGSEIWQSDGTGATTHRLQETLLYNNFFVISSMAFNSIFATMGSQLLFTMLRRPYDTQIPIYTYDTSLNDVTTFAPSVLIPVSLANNSIHLIWNRIDNATKYHVRHQSVIPGSTWKSKMVTQSFTNIIFDAGVDYKIQVRSFSDNTWTAWSDTLLYSPSFIRHDYTVNILADRSEDATTTRIYWLKTPEITKLQLHYRVAGTTTWTTLTNGTGFIRITGLIPNAFYEYQYRPYISGNWGDWYPTSLHFMTPNTDVQPAITGSKLSKTELQLSLSPNPAKGLLYIQNETPSNAWFIVIDVFGRTLKTGKLNNNTIDLSGLPSGMLTIIVQKEAFKQSGKVLKE